MLILSARRGLLDFDQVLGPYDTTFGDPAAVTGQQVAEQADRLGVRGAAQVVVLGGRRYIAATRLAWPHSPSSAAGRPHSPTPRAGGH
jgi:hypothetical protein